MVVAEVLVDVALSVAFFAEDEVDVLVVAVFVVDVNVVVVAMFPWTLPAVCFNWDLAEGLVAAMSTICVAEKDDLI